MSDYTLAAGAGKTRILVAVPSLDTPVSDMEARRFSEEAGKMPNAIIGASSYVKAIGFWLQSGTPRNFVVAIDRPVLAE